VRGSRSAVDTAGGTSAGTCKCPRESCGWGSKPWSAESASTAPARRARGPNVVDVRMRCDPNRRFGGHGPLLQKASPSSAMGGASTRGRPPWVRIAAESSQATGLRAFADVTAYLIPTTIESGPTRCSTRVDKNPASVIQPAQSAPV
jgi:hypothetical protein